MYKNKFGVAGKDEGQLWYPRKVAVIKVNKVLVPGKDEGQLWYPRKMLVMAHLGELKDFRFADE